eukprot:ANDGO_01055.mRNA.1 hypothetical protein
MDQSKGLEVRRWSVSHTEGILSSARNSEEISRNLLNNAFLSDEQLGVVLQKCPPEVALEVLVSHTCWRNRAILASFVVAGLGGDGAREGGDGSAADPLMRLQIETAARLVQQADQTSRSSMLLRLSVLAPHYPDALTILKECRLSAQDAADVSDMCLLYFRWYALSLVNNSLHVEEAELHNRRELLCAKKNTSVLFAALLASYPHQTTDTIEKA